MRAALPEFVDGAGYLYTRRSELIPAIPQNLSDMVAPKALIRPRAVYRACDQLASSTSRSARFLSASPLRPANPTDGAAKDVPKRKPLTKEQRDFLSSAVRMIPPRHKPTSALRETNKPGDLASRQPSWRARRDSHLYGPNASNCF